MSANTVLTIVGGVTAGVAYLVGFILGRKLGKEEGYSQAMISQIKATPLIYPFISKDEES